MKRKGPASCQSKYCKICINKSHRSIACSLHSYPPVCKLPSPRKHTSGHLRSLPIELCNHLAVTPYPAGIMIPLGSYALHLATFSITPSPCAPETCHCHLISSVNRNLRCCCCHPRRRKDGFTGTSTQSQTTTPPWTAQSGPNRRPGARKPLPGFSGSLTDTTHVKSRRRRRKGERMTDDI